MNRGGTRKGVRPIATAICVLAALAAPAAAAEPLSLEECFTTALRHNPGLEGLRLETAAAGWDVRAARAEYYPRLGAAAQYARVSDVPVIEVPLPPPAGGEISIADTESYRGGLSAGWLLWGGGARSQRSRIALLDRDRAKLAERAAAEELLLQVSGTYFSLLGAGRRRDLLEEERRRVEEHRRLAEAFFDEGAAVRTDVLAASVRLSRIELELLRAVQEEKLQAVRLSVLLGGDPDESLRVEEIAGREPPPPPDPAEARTRALRQRTEFAVLRLQEEQAERAVRLARSGSLPRLSLSANYHLLSRGGATMPEEGSWDAGAAAEWSVFDGGRTKSRVGKARAQQQRLGSLRRQVEQRVLLEVEEALLRRREADRGVETSRAAEAAAAENLRVTREVYRARAGTSADVLDAETDFTAARTTSYDWLYRAWAADWALRRATGDLAGRVAAGTIEGNQRAHGAPGLGRTTREMKE